MNLLSAFLCLRPLFLWVPVTYSYPLRVNGLQSPKVAALEGEFIKDAAAISSKVRQANAPISPLSDEELLTARHLLRVAFRSRHRRKRINMVKEALRYLRRYGYISGVSSGKDLKKALRAFQDMAGIEATGDLSAPTIAKMRQRRCGVADAGFTPRTDLGGKKKRFTQVSKWFGKMNSHDVLRLKWRIAKYSQKMHSEATRLVVRSAFKIWSDQIAIPSMRTAKLEFSESNDEDSDIDILFATGEHGDQYPFDGAGNSSNILAHTFYPNYLPYDPLNGDIHFDDSENWTLDPYRSSGNPYFPYVLVHEIGHALGLGHSKRQEAVMNPIYKNTPLSTVTLDIDDKCALNWNYIGPSNICLFVWLMVELLPRARNSTVVDLHGQLSRHQEMREAHKLGKLTVGDNDLDAYRKVPTSSGKDIFIPTCKADKNLRRYIRLMLTNRLGISHSRASQLCHRLCKLLERLPLTKHQDDGNKPMEQLVDLVTYPDNLSQPDDDATKKNGVSLSQVMDSLVLKLPQ
uniref:ZnMc domain-containing protein n=1 Tax=Trichuris muris TaxID=70415 RepID=A0A5S6QNL1_TRIMR